MVHPDIVALLHRDAVGAVVRLRLDYVYIPYDDVGCLIEEESDILHLEVVCSDYRQIVSALDVKPRAAGIPAVIFGERAAEPYHSRLRALVLLTKFEPLAELLAVIEMMHLAAFASGRSLRVSIQTVKLHASGHRRLRLLRSHRYLRIFRCLGILRVLRIFRVCRVLRICGILRSLYLFRRGQGFILAGHEGKRHEDGQYEKQSFHDKSMY